MERPDASDRELTTRTAVLRLLCTSRRTAGELAEELQLSATAVRKVLTRLEVEGLVRYARVSRGVGKPAHEYEVTQKGEQYISQAYVPLLLALVQQLRGSITATELESVLRDAGRHLAPAVHPRTREEGIRTAVDLLNSLGAAATVIDSARAPRIECSCCAIAAVVLAEPLACKAVEALISEIVGAPFVESCDRSDRPQCRFELAAPQGV